MDTNQKRTELRDRVRADPDAWWRILQDLIAQAPDPQYLQRLAYAPLRMTLECGGERLLHEAVSIARTSPRMASAVKGWPSRPTSDLYPLFGRDLVVDALIRHYSHPTGFDFWAWEVVRNLVTDDPSEAWLLILALLHTAPDDGVLGSVAARGVRPGSCRGLHRSDRRRSRRKLEIQIGAQLPVRLEVVAGFVRPNRGCRRGAADAPRRALTTLRQHSGRRVAVSAGRSRCPDADRRSS